MFESRLAASRRKRGETKCFDCLIVGVSSRDLQDSMLQSEAAPKEVAVVFLQEPSPSISWSLVEAVPSKALFETGSRFQSNRWRSTGATSKLREGTASSYGAPLRLANVLNKYRLALNERSKKRGPLQSIPRLFWVV